MDKAHILVIDDEKEVRDLITEYLGKQEFEVSSVGGVVAAREILNAGTGGRPVALVILDLRMPGENGLVLARELRDRGDVAVIILTASGETIDRVVGLEMGADDYIAKPFDPRELLARIRSVLRRVGTGARATSGQAAGAEAVPREAVRFGRCLIDREARRMFEKDGTEVPLTAMQFSLIEAFLDNPNRVLTRDRLLDLSHKRGDDPFDRSIDIRITRLRRKIEEHPEKPKTIRTVHGVGYVYAPAET
ncbi:response regulator [Skermanella stibiiresistens]|uniref:response regulator n=1 Tax=Skermanella stibiiresistens TaxID=913326 RepID=UPI0018DB9E08|nr:response regulator [Skermanella stibiiresistens]